MSQQKVAMFAKLKHLLCGVGAW